LILHFLPFIAPPTTCHFPSTGFLQFSFTSSPVTLIVFSRMGTFMERSRT
jgi:hypothetical protein